MKAKTINYIDSLELWDEVSRYKETGTITERLGELMLSMCRHITEHRCFRGYSCEIKDDMVGDGVARLVHALDPVSLGDGRTD